MLFYTGLFFLVIAVSLDSFGVGIAYGMRPVRVPLSAISIIMCCSGIVVLVSMTIGSVLSTIISVYVAKLIGGMILVLLGLFCLWNVTQSSSDQINVFQTEGSQLNQFKSVMKEPRCADLDQSGTISAQEAILLGFALALDAFAAGIGAALLGYSPIFTSILVALMSGLFVFCGTRVGMILSNSTWMKKMNVLPPLLLIFLGIFNMM